MRTFIVSAVVFVIVASSGVLAMALRPSSAKCAACMTGGMCLNHYNCMNGCVCMKTGRGPSGVCASMN